MKRTQTILFLIGVLAVTLIGAFFIYPSSLTSWIENLRPWRLGLDLVGGSRLIYEINLSQVDEGDREETASGLRDVIERRVNLFGAREPQVLISKTGERHYLHVELAGISDVSQAVAEIGLTPFLEFREVLEGDSFLASTTPTGLTGRYVKGAKLEFQQTIGQPQIALEFSKEGADLFEEVTARNVGKVVGIFLDGAPISLPRVNEKISGGQAVITGSFTVQEAREIVRRFNAGALPAPIILQNQQTVGASLGKDSLEASILAGLIGTALVIVFMLIYYRFYGLLASLALLVYAIIALAIFKTFLTMTLAGIAGFLLSIGMAVDANILIFERTKEEFKKGSPRLTAIREGFFRAWPSIRDSNVSTIITSLILFYMTSGFVKGLALTLLLGVLVSMFTAISVTRGLMMIFARERTIS